MPRSLTTGMQNASTAKLFRPVILIKAEFDSGHLRLWNGVGDFTYNSEIYTGAGTLLSISEIKETTSIQANGMQLGLSGIPASIVSIGLNENYQDRPLTIWLGAIDDSGNLISNPVRMFKGKMDVLSFEESGETATALLSVENILIDLQRDKTRNYTHEDQQIEFTGDEGFKFITSLQEKEVIWGR
ncbi:MAG TPA: hypothetical protein DIV86_01555 [Alphaproteobacteria bacterium]|nr:hypothetical protein [Alphaproteobacteria bacterium]